MSLPPDWLKDFEEVGTGARKACNGVVSFKVGEGCSIMVASQLASLYNLSSLIVYRACSLPGLV